MNQKDFDCFIQALGLTDIILSLVTFSLPLGIIAGAAIVSSLCLIIYDNDKDNDDNREEK